MIGLIERALFGPPAPEPFAGWVCANCLLPLSLAKSIHRHGNYLICDRCERAHA